MDHSRPPGYSTQDGVYAIQLPNLLSITHEKDDAFEDEVKKAGSKGESSPTSPPASVGKKKLTPYGFDQIWNTTKCQKEAKTQPAATNNVFSFF